MTKRICCEPGCGKPADFQIFETRTDRAACDNLLETCQEHVSTMLGTAIPYEKETTHWEIYSIPAPKPVEAGR